MGIGGASFGLASSAYGAPFYDTGTVNFFLPTAVYNALVAAVNHSAGAASLFPGQTLAAGACFKNANVTAAQVDAMLPAMSTTLPDEAGGSFALSAAPTKSYLIVGSGGSYCLAARDSGSAAGLTIFGDRLRARPRLRPAVTSSGELL
jgi:hypothetical protein